MDIFLGTQGWSYKDWVGPFYPPKTKPADYLRRYSESFDAVELDTTFYGSPAPSRVDAWKQATPDSFRFAAKLPRSITHDRRLIQAGAEVDEFTAVMQRLGRKLGPLLIQLPPDFRWDERPSLEQFLPSLPTGLRFAAEFRHRSWLRPETFEMLAEHNVAWTNIDLVYMPKRVELTADFSYFRFLGDHRAISYLGETQVDRTGALDTWAETIKEVGQRVKTIYGFANNHYSGHSPNDVRYLRRRLAIGSRRHAEQGTLI
ncbi:MAG: DUF72 domain-containing protein [Chloroflexota bacterium]